MASTRPATKPPITKPKPRGINVKAFVESVESGSKPKPDFFKSSTKKPETGDNATQKFDYKQQNLKPDIPTKPDTTRKPSLTKPAITHKKPSLTSKPAAPLAGDIQKPSVPPPAPPTASSAAGVSPPSQQQLQAEEEAASEDSGHSTCDLKYSGE